jgi:hypothetical protein
MTGGGAHMLRSLAQAVLWMATLTGVLTCGLGLTQQPTLEQMPFAWACAGGCCFGLGAVINSSCSQSDLHRRADGELRLLATLAGFARGVAAWLAIRAIAGPIELVPAASPWLRWPALRPWVLARLVICALLRLRRRRHTVRCSGSRWP